MVLPLPSRPEWLACRNILSWPKQHSTAEKLFKAASAADLDDLISIAQSGDSEDQHVALSTLEYFSRAKLDGRWTAVRRDRLLRILREHFVERWSDPIAQHSVSLLRIMDPAWIEHFLTGIPLDEVAEEDRPKLVYDLSNILTEKSRERLLLMIEAGWEGTTSVKWPFNAAPGSLPSPPVPDDWDYNPHTRVTGPLLSSPEWKHLLKSQAPLQEVLLWLDSITEADVAALADAWEGDDPAHRRCAGAAIRQLALRNDARLSPYRTRILKQAQSMSATIFEKTGILPSEYYAIRDFSREHAIDFVLTCVEQESSTARHLQSAFREMMTLGGPRIIARIEQLAAQGGPLAKDAVTFLDEMGPVTPEKIDAKAKRWRETANQRDLKWLFFSHIERSVPQGSSIEPILALLGKPSEQGGRYFSWKSKGSPVHFYLETDRSGNLDWMKLYVD
jgi:hypothetical protein